MSLLQNNKQTTKDEWILLGFILLLVLLGALLLSAELSLWIFDAVCFKTLGAMLLFTGVVLFPVLVYRFLTNNKKK